MHKAPVAEYPVAKITQPEKGEQIHDMKANDLLAVEQPLEIRIGYGSIEERQQSAVSVTMCTPGNDFELSAGFLFTEGILKKKEDMVSCRYVGDVNSPGNKNNIVLVELQPGVEFDPKKLQRHFYTSSSCGVCGKSSIDAVWNVIEKRDAADAIRIPASIIISLPELLKKRQEVFGQTGGLHASALFDIHGRLLYVHEDVGRHNALDKLVGVALSAGELPLDQHLLLLSGRASFELVQKAAMAGIRIVCAVGAPSSLAVDMAREFGITLIGFLRDQRFNIYTGGERVEV